MSKLLVTNLFLVLFLLGKSQSPYVFITFKLPIHKSEYTNETYCCDHLNAGEIAVNRKVEVWLRRVDSFNSYAMMFDSVCLCYKTTDTVMKLLKSDFYYAYSYAGYKSIDLFRGPNQNKFSPECKLSSQDSMVTNTVRYRLACKDCVYPKRRQMYYMFFNNKYGITVRHGLAYLKKGKPKIK
jgi:hypothetical protein